MDETKADLPKVSLDEIAHHEAGHAVVSILRELDIEKATIVPDGDILGVVRNSKEVQDRMESGKDIPEATYDQMIEHYQTEADQQQLRFHLIDIKLAGIVAEKKYANKDVSIGVADYEEALISSLDEGICETEHEAHAFLKWREVVVEDLFEVGRYWKAVEALAAELLERKTINGNDVKAIVYGQFKRSSKPS